MEEEAEVLIHVVFHERGTYKTEDRPFFSIWQEFVPTKQLSPIPRFWLTEKGVMKFAEKVRQANVRNGFKTKILERR